MAGDWIKMRTHLAAERATMTICDLTGLDQFAVVGRLHSVWCWAGEHTSHGDVRGVTLKTIDRIASHEGFASAMLAAEWLEELPDGGLRFPRWKKHNSKSARARALANERQAKRRAAMSRGKRDSQRDTSVTSHASRIDKSREEKETPTPFPDCLNTERFRVAWSEWKAHRLEIRKPLKPTQARKQLAMLADIGEQRAVVMIAHTIEKGWQGLREPDRAGNALTPVPVASKPPSEVPKYIPKARFS